MSLIHFVFVSRKMHDFDYEKHTLTFTIDSKVVSLLVPGNSPSPRLERRPILRLATHWSDRCNAARAVAWIRFPPRGSGHKP